MTTLTRDERAANGAPIPVRTGVTAIIPRGKTSASPVFGAWFPLNGNGEMTGTHWLDESGFLEGPIMITNTHSVGIVRDAIAALDAANGYCPVGEGNVGGGTGMICYEFKCGTGTSSRVIKDNDQTYTVGVLVQANHGARNQLMVAGVPVGHHITENAPFSGGRDLDNERGSIIIVVATDAPLLPHQLRRLAKRAALGLARTGGRAGNGSGDIFIAFSTANPHAADHGQSVSIASFVPNERMNAIFNGVVLATEEAIVNALVAGQSMTDMDRHHVDAIPTTS